MNDMVLNIIKSWHLKLYFYLKYQKDNYAFVTLLMLNCMAWREMSELLHLLYCFLLSIISICYLIKYNLFNAISTIWRSNLV